MHQVCRDDRTDGTATAHVLASDKLLKGDARFFAKTSEQSGCFACTGITLIGVGFDRDPMIDLGSVAGRMLGGMVGMLRVSHVGADYE